MMPFFSVVIPLYNKQSYIKNTLKSVLQQDFTNFEIIVINDGSTDNSEKIVKKINDERIRLISQSNKGVSHARNTGIKHAEGKIIAFLDADDFWYPGHLSEIYQLYQNFPDACLFSTAYEIEYTGGLTKTFVLNKKSSPLLLHPFYKYSFGFPLFYPSNFALKKNIFKKETAFKEYIHAEDTELFLRLGYTYPLAYSKKITMRHIDKAENSLFSAYDIDKKILILKELEVYENKDPFMKKVLDLNRFSWTLEYKMKNQPKKASLLKKQISFKNLNFKQKLLLKLPGNILNMLKKIQQFLRQKKIYYTIFNNSN